MVRHAHHPERSRGTNSNVQNSNFQKVSNFDIRISNFLRRRFMGKIRVKTLGIEGLEEEQKKEARLASEAKRAKKRKEKKKTVKAPGLKGGERVAMVGPSEEELTKLEVTQAPETPKLEEQKPKKAATKKISKKARSSRYKSVRLLVEQKLYPLLEALELLKKLKTANFDETVELHANTIGTGISGNLVLPHGTGKKTRVAIASEELIGSIEKGKIDFDVLLATPEMMPKIAKVAKFLGPRGLMPNPKNGTITPNPEELAKKYEDGQISFKTEAKAPIIHLVVGKLSFSEKDLSENIKAIIAAIQPSKIKNITLKSTMSPGIKIDLQTI